MTTSRHDHIAGAIADLQLPGYTGMIGLDTEGTVRYVSPSLDGVFGFVIAEVLGRNFVEFVAADEAEQATQSFLAVMERAGYHQVLETALCGTDGTNYPVAVVAENRLDDPEIGLVLINVGDHRDRRRSIQLLAAQAEIARKIALGNSLEVALDEIVQFVERALPGFRAAAYFHDDLAEHRATHARSLPEAFTSRIAASIARGERVPGTQVMAEQEAIVAPDLGLDEWADAAACAAGEVPAIWSGPIRYDKGSNLLGVFEIYPPHPAHPRDEDWTIFRLASRLSSVAFGRVVTQRQLVHEAEIDPLTGAPNRRVVTSVLTSMLADGAAGRVVCFIDLDRLKVVNDGLGHEAGDRLIQEAAERLRRHLGDAAIVGRFGGDEFVAVSADASHSPTELAARCMRAFDTPVTVGGRSWQLSASIGVVAVEGQRTASEVLRDADAAMYEAKQAGRGRWQLFDAATRETVVRRMRLEQMLPRAIEREEIETWYQPVVRSSDWSLRAVEGLSRWQLDDGTFVAPDEFIPLVEELGLIDTLGAQLIERALDVSLELTATLGRATHASINVSPLQLQGDALFASLERARSEGLPLGHLYLEMTEQHMVDETHLTLDHFHRLIELGVRLAVDDFGTGYSSLGALHRLPARTLKIDRQLTSQVGEQTGKAVIAAVVGVAKAYAMATVAEGVERADQALALRRLGVDYQQGFLFAQALPRPVLVEDVAVDPWPWNVAKEALVEPGFGVGAHRPAGGRVDARPAVHASATRR